MKSCFLFAVRSWKRKAKYCLLPLIPILLFVLAIAVTTPSLEVRDQPKSSKRQYEVSSQHTPVYIGNGCYNTSNVAPLIRLGTIYGRWYDEVVITQVKQDAYIPEDMNIYAVPSQGVSTYKKKFFCRSTDKFATYHVLNLNRLYLLRGSNMTFNLCINSTSTQEPGWVDLSIYSNITEYLHTTMGAGFHQFHVDANQTNCSSYTYVAPSDGFYYAGSGLPHKQTKFAMLVSFRVDIEMLYINHSDFLHGSTSYGPSVCNPIDESEIKCSVKFSDDWFFSAKHYDIFALGTASSEAGHLALVKWKSSFRKQWYTVPVIAGAILGFLVFLICVGCSYCAYRRKVCGRSYSVNRKKEQKQGYGSTDVQPLITN